MWGSNKANKVVHALLMQLSNGQVLSLPSGEQGKRGAPWATPIRQREASGEPSGKKEHKKGCQVKDCKWGTPWSKVWGKYEMFFTLHFGELNDGITLELESGKQWVPREKFQPDASKGGKGGKGKGGKGKKSGGQRQTRNAFTIKVKDVDGSDEVHQEVHVTVNKELISTILGLQAGTVQKLDTSRDKRDRFCSPFVKEVR